MGGFYVKDGRAGVGSHKVFSLEGREAQHLFTSDRADMTAANVILVASKDG